MNIRFYQRLAWSGMKKNGKLYIPYLLTCIGMVMMSYILQSLSVCPLLRHMRGGGSVEMALSLGKFVVAFFALIFLIYTNSFLVRRRNKEFGLYHILGMGKKGIRRIIFWETLTTALIGLVGGLFLGVTFSKIAELVLANILQQTTDYSFTLKWEAFRWTLIVYGIIFIILMGNALISVQRTKTLELFQSEKLGEKPPKANWFLALVGVVLLAAAYFMAVSIKNPLSALLYFFVAVLMVILATYLLFIAGSVVLCKTLQKNKAYYYKKQHFVSVSSMTYRMKRNGAGLASICILSTMVLVMLSSTGSLYFGMEDTLMRRYPREISLAPYFPELDSLTPENINELRGAYEQVLEEHGVSKANLLEYSYIHIAGLLEGEEVLLHSYTVYADDIQVMDRLREFVFVSAEDYNRATGEKLQPAEGEAYVFPMRCEFDGEELHLDEICFRVKGTLTKTIPIFDDTAASVVPCVVVVVPDLMSLRPLQDRLDSMGYPLLNVKWGYAYDLPGVPEEEVYEIYRAQQDKILDMEFLQWSDGYSYSATCRSEEKEDFLNTFGGMFFLGIILSLIFVAATVLIIYYKQICEGYEDQSRFEIMQKVGMTGEDIRKNINSQILTVFFAPLVLAGVHLAFAYPLIWKILQLFFMRNLGFVIAVTIGIYLVFGVFYAVVYKLTAVAYYHIVSGENGDECH